MPHSQGGTLARDVDYLTQIGEREHVATHLLRAVRTSNDEHKRWAWRTLESLVGTDGGLERPRHRGLGPRLQAGDGYAAPVELGRALPRARPVREPSFGHTTRLCEPCPDDLAGVFTLCATPFDAAEGASAIVVETDWPAYHAVDPGGLVATMRTPIVVDANGFLSATLGDVAGVRYVRVGGRAR